MKQLMFIVMFLFSCTAISCPLINGMYEGQPGHIVKFATSVENDIFTYTVNTGSFTADSNPHEIIDEGRKVVYSANCFSNKWFGHSTIFNPEKQTVQVGSGTFTQIDSDTVNYDFSISLYSSSGDVLYNVPGAHTTFKRKNSPGGTEQK